MKFKCPICQAGIRADLVLAHEAAHKQERVQEAHDEINRLSLPERLAVLHAFCDLCGRQVNADGECLHPACDTEAEDESERPQGGRKAASPLPPEPSLPPVGVRPMIEYRRKS